MKLVKHVDVYRDNVLLDGEPIPFALSRDWIDVRYDGYDGLVEVTLKIPALSAQVHPETYSPES